ncbi:MAG: carbamoyl-phosphate synthase domain-containing protein, partial [Anaerovorax sp.]
MKGKSFGTVGKTIGQMAFDTSITGCQERLTDEKSKGKIITQTFPLVGNYGLNDEDYTSDRVWAKGYIVREWCEEPSNFRSKYTIDEFLEKHNTVGISNIDTRSLTKKIRDAGTLKGAIVAELPADLNQLISEIKNETGEAE